MAIRINRGFKSMEALKAKYRKKAKSKKDPKGKLWYLNKSLYAQYTKERDSKLGKSRAKWGKKTTRKTTAKKGKTKGLSAFGEAGVTLRRLGYTNKLTSKNLDTLAKRKKKIKAMKAKGATAKQWEGVRRPTAKGSAKRTKGKTAFQRKPKKARRKAYRDAHGPDWSYSVSIKERFDAGKAP